jgi:hypothetical protein
MPRAHRFVGHLYRWLAAPGTFIPRRQSICEYLSQGKRRICFRIYAFFMFDIPF